MEKEKILGVFEPEVGNFLKNIGLYDEIVKGSLKCAFCEKIITESNFGSFIKNDKKIFISCDDASCIIQNSNRRKD